MKKVLKRMLLVAMAIGTFAADANAQEQKESNENPLVGIWQLHTPAYDKNSGEITIVGRPILKIIKEDGSYLAIYGTTNTLQGSRVANTNMTISQEGRYEIKNDSIYHEQIDKHYINPSMVGSTSVMKYKFIDPEKQSMRVTYSNGNMPLPGNELWIKLSPTKIKSEH